MRSRTAFGLACLGALAAVTPAAAGDEAVPSFECVMQTSAFTIAMLDTPVPELTVAQRAIHRDWGPSDDSTYVEVELPDWKSEGGAMVASAVIPGTGQLYVGQRSGYLFLLAEAAGWTARSMFLKDADEHRDRGEAYAGPPGLPGSSWSASRWAQATGGDPTALIALYYGDRGAFLHRIATDPALLSGWSGPDPEASREGLDILLGDADKAQRRANYVGGALWLNHLIAAADALRAARIHNIPIQRNLELRLKSSWKHGNPGVRVTLAGRF
jgi:hypothetical protein